MSNVIDHDKFYSQKNHKFINDKPVSIEDHVAECKHHEIVYHGFQCPLCRTAKKFNFLDDLEDSLYFQGIMNRPSKKTQEALKQRKNHVKKTRTNTAKN